MSAVKGWREKKKAAKALQKHEAEVAKELLNYEAAHQEWQKSYDEVDTLLYMVTHLDEVYEQSGADPMAIRLKSGEHIIMRAGGRRARRAAGDRPLRGRLCGCQREGCKGVRFRVGQHRGTYVRGPEEQKLIAEGDLFITSHRVVFTSDTHNREWDFGKTLITARPSTSIAA